MNDHPKPWFLSNGIVASIIGGVVVILGATGVIGPDQAELAEADLLGMWDRGVTLVLFGWAAWGRYRAKAPIE